MHVPVALCPMGLSHAANQEHAWTARSCATPASGEQRSAVTGPASPHPGAPDAVADGGDVGAVEEIDARGRAEQEHGRDDGASKDPATHQKLPRRPTDPGPITSVALLFDVPDG